MPKRFLIFGGYSYYPKGGWEDLLCSFDTLELAKEAIEVLEFGFTISGKERDWYQIVDTTTGTIEEKRDTYLEHDC